MLDTVLEFFYEMAYDAIDILPDSPFLQFEHELNSTPFGGQIMSWINYFVPIGGMMGIGTFYLGSVLFFYGAKLLLKWSKLI